MMQTYCIKCGIIYPTNSTLPHQCYEANISVFNQPYESPNEKISNNLQLIIEKLDKIIEALKND